MRQYVDRNIGKDVYLKPRRGKDKTDLHTDR